MKKAGAQWLLINIVACHNFSFFHVPLAAVGQTREVKGCKPTAQQTYPTKQARDVLKTLKTVLIHQSYQKSDVSPNKKPIL